MTAPSKPAITVAMKAKLTWAIAWMSMHMPFILAVVDKVGHIFGIEVGVGH